MKNYKPKLPAHFVAYTQDDTEFWFRADYDAGEEQWFDARAGVGSPGYGPIADVTEVSFDAGKTWEPPYTYPQLNLDALEEQVHQFVQDQADAFWAGYAESMEDA